MASVDHLQELKLNDYYTQKLSFREAIKLRGESQTGGEEQYGLEIVRRLLLFDSEAVVSVTTELNKRLNNTGVNEVDNKVECDAEVGRPPEKSNVRPSWRKGNAEQKESKLHPMDLLVVVMSCCDDFLRQVLAEKMFLNKLSIPILLPSVRNGSHTFLLFALKSLVPEVQDRLRDSSDTLADTLVDVRSPIISFIRVGDLHRSKSKLVNDFINLSSFNTFYHRGCPNGYAKRSISNGSIEAAWFQSLTADELFNCRFFTALNLRGDARNYQNQTQFLCQSSTLTVLMVDSFESFKKLYEDVLKNVDFSQRKIIVSYVSLVSPDKVDDEWFNFLENLNASGKISSVVYDWHDGTNKMSDEDFTKQLRNTVSNIFKPEQSATQQISTYRAIIQSGVNFGFSLDEDKCEIGNTSADKFIDSVLKLQMDCKPIMLPLQGEPWNKIGKLEREQRAKSENQDEYFIAKKETEKREQREIQCDNLLHQSDIAMNFFLNLISFKNQTLLYYLNSCKVRLDSRSRVVISDLGQQYQKEKQENQVELSNEGEHEHIRSKKEVQIADSTIGLEHILREAGQMYEAVISEETRMKKKLEHAPITLDTIYNFPAVVAGLLLKGQPLELMDGDVSNVAITWVKAVLNQIRMMTINAKVFVLSIIGVQSSGKSTLLNALFGLQCPVSAGRCTRGIYCHLVAVDKESLHTEYEYVLVVDTEGLRATHLTGKSTFRDNELATFAIGLADATIINVKGENWTEMSDILQIAAHGLIRVRKTKVKLELMPRCMFVHQNVSAADAKEKNLLDRDKQLSLLDTAIKAAGRAEGFPDITKFNQVIKYDPESHSFYFPDFWNGQPPKSVVSQGYILRANELRQHIMQVMKDNPSRLMISGFLHRMTDLWNAMLHNDFVLCFRNTQEIIAGTILIDIISHEVDGFKNRNKLEQTKIRESICSFPNVVKLKAEKARILKDVNDAVNGNFSIMHATLKDIIDATDICSDLKEKYTVSLSDIKDGERLRISDEIEKEIIIHTKKLELHDEQNVKDLKEGMARLEKYIEEVEKHNFNETKVKNFENKWQEIVCKSKELINDRKGIVHKEIKDAIRASIEELSGKGKLHLETPISSEIFQTPFNDKMPQVIENDIVKRHNTYKPTRLVMDLMYSKSHYEANRSINGAYKKWELHFQKQRGLDFDPSQLKNILFKVGQLLGTSRKEEYGTQTETEETCSSLPPGYRYSDNYLIRFLKFACHYTYTRCHENNEIFISLTDPLSDIHERQKRSVSRSRQMSAEANIDDVSKQIFDYAERYFVRDLGYLIKREVCDVDNENPTFKYKRIFLKTILCDLGQKTHKSNGVKTEKENIFKDYMLYVQMAESETSKTFFHNVIITLLKDLLTKQHEGESQTVFVRMVESYVGRIILKATDALMYAEENCSGCSKTYIQIFKDYMHITSEIEFSISTLSDFTVAVVDRIKKSYTDFLNQANSSFEKLLRENDNAAIGIVLEKLMGCRQKCPFCSAPCSQSMEKHAGDHRAYHYPMGVCGTNEIKGWFRDTEETRDASEEEQMKPRKLTLSTCQAMVDTSADIRTMVTVKKATKWYHRNYHPFKKYKELDEYKDWDIPYSRNLNSSLYWKWFMAQFGKELAEEHKAVCPEIPEAWEKVTWEEAEKNLDELVLDSHFDF